MKKKIKKYDLGNMIIQKGGVGSGRARTITPQSTGLPVLSIDEKGRISGQGIRRVPIGIRDTAEYIGVRAGLGAAEAAIEGAVGTLVDTTIGYLDRKREIGLQQRLKQKAGIRYHKRKPLNARQRVELTNRVVSDTLDYTLDAGLMGAIHGSIRGINEKLATNPKTAPFRINVNPETLVRAVNTAKIHLLRQERTIANDMVMQYPGKNLKQKALRMKRDNPDGFRYYRVLVNMANLRDTAEEEKSKRRKSGVSFLSRLKSRFSRFRKSDAELFTKALLSTPVEGTMLVREDLGSKKKKKKIKKGMRADLLAACEDLFGYPEDNFGGMNYDEILDYLSDKQKKEIKLYRREKDE